MSGVTTIHVWDGSHIALDISGSSVIKYIRGINLILSDKSGTKSYYEYNAHGDVVRLSNASGATVQSYRYDAFGVEQSPSEGDTNPFRYCGEYFDIETGTIYLRARYYQPTTGRFLAEDSFRSRKINIFDPYGNYQDIQLNGGRFVNWKTQQYIVDDPLSLNLYTYAQNNPLMYTDPSGHVVTPVNVIGAVIGAGGGAALGVAIADYYGLTGWKRAATIAGFTVGGAAIGWFAGPAVEKLATTIAIKMGIITTTAAKLGKDAIDFAVTNTSRLQHAFRHATDLGFGNWNNQTAQQWKDYIISNLNNYSQTFQNTLGKDPVTGYYRFVNGIHTAVYIYNEGPYKGLVATVVKLSIEQLKKFKLGGY